MSNPAQAGSALSDASKAKNKPSKFRRNMLMMLVTLFAIPLALLLRKPKAAAGAAAAAAHLD